MKLAEHEQYGTPAAELPRLFQRMLADTPGQAPRRTTRQIEGLLFVTRDSRPVPVPERTSPAPSLQAPGLWRRMACWTYEGVLLFAVVFIAGWLFSTLGQMRDAMDARRPLLQAFLFIVFGIYFTWFWARGHTLAMKTWNIRIVDRFGRPVSQKRAALRYLLSWVWFLPPLAVLAPLGLRGGEVAVLVLGWVAVWALLSRFHPQGQFWHDAAAGTRLVPDEQP